MPRVRETRQSIHKRLWRSRAESQGYSQASPSQELRGSYAFQEAQIYPDFGRHLQEDPNLPQIRVQASRQSHRAQHQNNCYFLYSEREQKLHALDKQDHASSRPPQLVHVSPHPDLFRHKLLTPALLNNHPPLKAQNPLRVHLEQGMHDWDSNLLPTDAENQK